MTKATHWSEQFAMNSCESDGDRKNEQGGFQAAVDAYKQHIDRTLLRENLKLSVDERFEKFKRMMELHDELARAGAAVRKRDGR